MVIESDSALVETAEPVTPAAEPVAEVSSEDKAADAFTKGSAEVTPKAPDAVVDEPKPDAETVKDAVPAATKDEAEEPDPVEEEIVALGLKEKTAARFRELAKRPTEEEVEPLRKQAARADEWERTVSATGTNPQQFAEVLAWMTNINSSDPKKLEIALQGIQNVAQRLATQLGREIPGLVDPLKDHPDLAHEVEAGDLPRARALEIANSRAMVARTGEFAQRSQAEVQQRQVVDRAMSGIDALNAELKAADPTFLQKLDALQPALAVIRENLPASQWVAAVRRAYQALPAVTPAAVKPLVSAVPLRPTGANAGMIRKPQNDVEAFEMGMASLRP